MPTFIALLLALIFLGETHDLRAEPMPSGHADIVDHTSAAPAPVVVAGTPGSSIQPSAATDGATLFVAWREERPDEVYMLYAATTADGLTWRANPIPLTIDAWQPAVAVLAPGHFRVTYWQYGSYQTIDWRAGAWRPLRHQLQLPAVAR